VFDVLRNGLIMVQVNSGAAAPVKGGRVFVWCAADAAGHLEGGYETVFSAGNTVQLDPRYIFNGGMDANFVAELSVNV
jgi:hypothetical protein